MDGKEAKKTVLGVVNRLYNNPELPTSFIDYVKRLVEADDKFEDITASETLINMGFKYSFDGDYTSEEENSFGENFLRVDDTRRPESINIRDGRILVNFYADETMLKLSQKLLSEVQWRKQNLLPQLIKEFEARKESFRKKVIK